MVNPLKHLGYAERLKALHLPTPSIQEAYRGDMIAVYNIYHGRFDRLFTLIYSYCNTHHTIEDMDSSILLEQILRRTSNLTFFSVFLEQILRRTSQNFFEKKSEKFFLIDICSRKKWLNPCPLYSVVGKKKTKLFCEFDDCSIRVVSECHYVFRYYTEYFCLRFDV